MKRILTLTVAVMIMTGSLAYAETQMEALAAKEAIAQAGELATVEQQVEYLLKQGEAFFENQRFSEARSVAEYILLKLDNEQEEAVQLLSRANQNIKE